MARTGGLKVCLEPKGTDAACWANDGNAQVAAFEKNRKMFPAIIKGSPMPSIIQGDNAAPQLRFADYCFFSSMPKVPWINRTEFWFLLKKTFNSGSNSGLIILP